MLSTSTNRNAAFKLGLVSRFTRSFTAATLGMALGAFAPAALALDNNEAAQAAERSLGGYCSATANALLRACRYAADDDYWVAFAICINESNSSDRAECYADATTSRREAKQLCGDQLTERGNNCRLLGEGRYDPPFDEEYFDADFRNLTNPNPYFPLTIGNKWEYRGGTETVTVHVLNQTKLIDDVTCIVVRDLVYDKGKLKEATDDWFAQHKDRSVWYCGEEVKDYENFAGDKPRRAELVSIDGSFKAGRDGDKAGIIFPASPNPGQAYLEESSLANAEDMSQILSTTYSFGGNPELDRFVPRQLVDRFCASRDCVVVKAFTAIEPGKFARKYYAKGIGAILEVKPDTGEISQLVNCNFDARCSGLPTP